MAVDIGIKLDKISYDITSYLGVIIILAAIVLFWLLSFECKEYKEKKIFLESMYQIKEEEITSELARIKAIINGLKSLKDRRIAKVLTKAKKKERKVGETSTSEISLEWSYFSL